MTVPARHLQKVLDALHQVTGLEPREHDSGWLCRCPSDTHGGDGHDSNPSLRVTVGEGGKLLITCRAGCQTRDVLRCAGLLYRDLFPQDADEAAALETLAAPNIPIDPSAERLASYDQVYSTLLQRLEIPEGEPLQQMTVRGLSVNHLTRLGYRYMTPFQRQGVIGTLIRQHGKEAVADLPGVARGSNGELYIPSVYEGWVIPLRDGFGRIRALKTRRSTAAEYKYALWSTRDNRAGNPCHCPLHPYGGANTVVRITEGEIKADIATERTGVLTLSVPGVPSWRYAIPLLRDHLKPRQALLALDWPDVCSKPAIAQHLLNLIAALKDIGIEPILETWRTPTGVKGDTTPFCKGIDDALVAGLPLTRVPADEIEGVLKPYLPIDLADSGEGPPDTPWVDRHPDEFPMDVFPPGVQSFVYQTAACTQTYCDLAAFGVLATASRALGGVRQVRLDNNWHERASLYLVIVAEPSTGKTPALKAAMRPLEERQEVESRRYARENATYQEERELWQVRMRHRRREDPPDPPLPPRPEESFFVQDFTRESLSKQLLANEVHQLKHDASLLVYLDEIMAWVNSFDQYRGGKGSDHEFWLSGWSGQSIKVDRSSRDGSIYLAKPYLSVLGGIQPDKLGALNVDKSGDAGFLARLLFCYPPPSKAYRSNHAQADPDISRHYDRVIGRLLALRPRTEQRREEEVYVPVTVELSEEARQEWACCIDILADQQDAGTLDPRIKSHWGKRRAYLGRFILLLHYLWWADAGFPEEHDVSVDTVRRAWTLSEYCLCHYQQVLDRLQDRPEDNVLTDLITYASRQGGEISLRDIYRKKRFKCKGQSDALRLCRMAQDRGWGTLVERLNSKTGRPSKVFVCQTKE